MQHRALVGIPFALVWFIIILMMGRVSAGRFTRRNLAIAFIGTSAFYALGLVN